MICSLCLEEIIEDQKTVVVEGSTRHKACSEEFDQMLDELQKIADETMPDDI